MLIYGRHEQPDDWLAEIAAHRDRIDSGAVRITQISLKIDGKVGRPLCVTAGAVLMGDAEHQLVELVVYVGDLLQLQPKDEPVQTRAMALVNKLVSRCKELGLEVLAGRFGILQDCAQQVELRGPVLHDVYLAG